MQWGKSVTYKLVLPPASKGECIAASSYMFKLLHYFMSKLLQYFMSKLLQYFTAAIKLLQYNTAAGCLPHRMQPRDHTSLLKS